MLYPWLGNPIDAPGVFHEPVRIHRGLHGGILQGMRKTTYADAIDRFLLTRKQPKPA